MKVELMSYTPDALNLLLRTKNTRLAFGSDPAEWPAEQRAEHLAYMLDTIRSSWEFVDYTFRIGGVTRAFTHQLIRTRHGSYAQESQRVVDASGNEVSKPKFKKSESLGKWEQAERVMMSVYKELLADGEVPQDARGILPTNINTSIVAKYTLRTLSEMAKVRLCTRTQGEYQGVFREMRQRVLEVHPWAEDFIQVQCVADGTCAFPRYGKASCPVYVPALNHDTLRAEQKVRFWGAERFASAPKGAAGGQSKEG